MEAGFGLRRLQLVWFEVVAAAAGQPPQGSRRDGKARLAIVLLRLALLAMAAWFAWAMMTAQGKDWCSGGGAVGGRLLLSCVQECCSCVELGRDGFVPSTPSMPLRKAPIFFFHLFEKHPEVAGLSLLWEGRLGTGDAPVDAEVLHRQQNNESSTLHKFTPPIN